MPEISHQEAMNKKTYQRKWVADRKAEYMDGKTCLFCDTGKDVEIHHLDPEQKEHHCIWSWSHERIEAELKKCVFVCEGCHTKFHALLKAVEFRHGLRSSYEKYGCRCDYCRAAKNIGAHGWRIKAKGVSHARGTLLRAYRLNGEQIDKLIFELFGELDDAV